MRRCRVSLSREAIALRRRAARAATAATIVMIVCGVGYRRLAIRLARPPEGTPLTSEHLQRLPLRLGQWSGAESPLDEAIIRATATDAHVNRMYRRPAGTVGLFVAYGIRVRDLAPHRPEVCYPGSGWTLQQTRTVDLIDAAGEQLPCTVYRFTGGGDLGARAVTVLNYYIIDGRISPDVSALRAKAWRGGDGVGYLAQVQITCADSGVSSASAADELAAMFAREMAPEILALFTEGSQG